jgi:hypothetical protein
MRNRRRTGLAAAVLVVLLGALGLAGCSAGGGDDASSWAVDAESGEAGAAAPEEASGGDAAGGGQGEAAEDSDGSVGVIDPGSGDRQVVTATLDVAVDDVADAAAQVRRLALTAGGSVAAESSSGGESPRAEITVRVPVEDTTEVMADVAGLGEEVSRTTDSEVVETRLVDLESRTATQRAGVERIRALLEQAETLEDVLRLEAELTRRQSELESVDAQRAALQDMAAMSTLTVTLTLPDDAEAPEEPLPPFLRGLDAGWQALVASTTVVLVVVGGLLPFVVVLAVGAGLLLAALRLVRRGRAGADSTREQPGQPPR